MFRFRSLGSGSTGNATLVEASDGAATTRLLIDCGFSARELETRLARAGTGCESIDAVFITHEHADHIGCALTLARRHRVPVWMSRGTWRAIGAPDIAHGIRFARDAETIAVGGLELKPYTVPHDAQEPLQLCVSNGSAKLAVLTDAGSITPYLLTCIADARALLLECNHDRGMLAASRYPESLKRRIGGRYGHLNNETSAQILASAMHAGLRHVVAAHLSAENNHPDIARAALATACGGTSADIVVADAPTGFDWLTIE